MVAPVAVMQRPQRIPIYRPPPRRPGRWVSVYAVPKMDCPSEERMIRLALNGFEEIRALSFDLSNRRLKVVHDGEVEPVTSKLKTLGLGASLQETVAANPETIKAAEFSAASAKQESGTLRWLLGINALLFVVEMTAGLIAQSTGLIGESRTILPMRRCTGLPFMRLDIA